MKRKREISNKKKKEPEFYSCFFFFSFLFFGLVLGFFLHKIHLSVINKVCCRLQHLQENLCLISEQFGLHFSFLVFTRKTYNCKLQLWFLTVQSAGMGDKHFSEFHIFHAGFTIKSSLTWCSILKESLSMYGGVWIFIKTIIFASFVMTCIKKQNKKKV